MNNSSDYGQGYQPQYPPQQPAPGLAYPQPMPPQQVVPPSFAYPQQGYGMPQQQMMMPPQPQQINVMVNNSVGVAGPSVRRHPPTAIRLIYFLCIGLYLGMFWLGLAVFFMCTIVGIPLGVMMLKQVPTVMLL